jgi:hypothetical protein
MRLSAMLPRSATRFNCYLSLEEVSNGQRGRAQMAMGTGFMARVKRRQVLGNYKHAFPFRIHCDSIKELPRRMVSSGMLRRVALVRTDVLEELGDKNR